MLKNSYPKGTVVYCWQFFLPITGWVGGLDNELWSDQRNRIAALAEHCDRPNRIIEAVSDGPRRFRGRL
jgi:hypothetical protein